MLMMISDFQHAKPYLAVVQCGVVYHSTVVMNRLHGRRSERGSTR
jgi:hypothetical protein